MSGLYNALGRRTDDEALLYKMNKSKSAQSPIFGASRYADTDRFILKNLPDAKTESAAKDTKVESKSEAQVDYDEKKTKLYRMVEKKKWDRVVLRLEKYPEEASIWVSRTDLSTNTISWRLLPIHAALYPVQTSDAEGKNIRCGIRAKIAVVVALLKAYPASVLARDDQGMTALHLASRNSAPVTVITKLLQMYPKALEVQDNKGRTPAQLLGESNTLGKERILNLLNEYSYDKRMKHEVRDDIDYEYLYGGTMANQETRE